LNSMSWSRALIVWTVLAISPLTGVRIVCVVDPPVNAASLQSDNALGCQTVCSRHPPAAYRSRCALVEDPTCTFALGFAAAVLPEQPAMPFTMTSEPVERVGRGAYSRPALDRASPPPKG
jgi:hypothetical protein